MVSEGHLPGRSPRRGQVQDARNHRLGLRQIQSQRLPGGSGHRFVR